MEKEIGFGNKYVMLWRWPHFTPDEMRCRKCSSLPPMTKEFTELMDWLETIRDHYGKPMPVSSGYRCPKHDTSAGRHCRAAVDIKVHHLSAFELIYTATYFGAYGLGIKQHGEVGDRFIHLDILSDLEAVWTYP